jgi:hypothetical protein
MTTVGQKRRGIARGHQGWRRENEAEVLVILSDASITNQCSAFLLVLDAIPPTHAILVTPAHEGKSMNGSTSVSPAAYWLTWPLQFAELATQTFRGNGIQAAPDVLAQNINPWTININSNNSSAPGTEQRILARHSYGRQLGRLMDAVDLLINDLEARKASISGDERVQDFYSLKDEIDDIKVKAAQRRLEGIEADLKLLRDADEPAYRELTARLQNLVRD